MNRAQLEAVLVGVTLPADKRELVEYARRQSPDAPEATALVEERVPDGTYATLQDVGEQVEPRQPPPDRARPPLPRPESRPPGGLAYVGESQEPANVAAVRERD